MRRPGLAVARDPASIIRQRESYDPAAEPADPSWGCLFDFNPTRSLLVDVEGGIVLSDPVGGVIVANANGHKAAEFSGTNYLLGASSPFAALSDLTGVSIYVVAEHTADGSTSTVGSSICLDRTAAAGIADRLMLANQGSDDTVRGSVTNAAATLATDAGTGLANHNLVSAEGFHVTLTSRTISQGAPGTASADATSVDPAGMDRCLIGAGAFGAAVAYKMTGRIYRVLICEGAFDQAVADYLAQLYTPRRLPPSVDPADVVFVFDARHGLYRDTLSGLDLTPTSAPYRVARGGDVAAYFDGTDDVLTGVWPDTGDLAQEYTCYLVAEHEVAGGIAYGWDVHTTSTTGSGATGGLRNTGSTGAYTFKKESSVFEVEYSGGFSTIGKIHLATSRFSPTELEAWLDGAGNGATAATRVPVSLDRFRVGAGIGFFGPEKRVYYCLMVRGGRDATAETWINANFPVGTSP